MQDVSFVTKYLTVIAGIINFNKYFFVCVVTICTPHEHQGKALLEEDTVNAYTTDSNITDPGFVYTQDTAHNSKTGKTCMYSLHKTLTCTFPA